MDKRIQSLERTTKIQTAIIAVLAIAMIWIALGSNPESDEILRTKGLIIEVVDGKQRMGLGFLIDYHLR